MNQTDYGAVNLMFAGTFNSIRLVVFNHKHNALKKIMEKAIWASSYTKVDTIL